VGFLLIKGEVMKYIYGPVNSRRLGLSLGLSLSPYKTCNFDCIYCQLGRTKEPAVERNQNPKIQDILGELKTWLENNPEQAKELKFITLSGLGEPTLNMQIGDVISEVRKITTVPLAVVTNASLLNDSGVRGALLEADLIVPSLNTVIPEIFAQLNRPGGEIKIGSIIEGLVNLRKEFRGKVWLEIMIVKGVNDYIGQVRKLKHAIDRISPDKVQLNSPVRTTADPGVFPATKRKLEKIKEILGEKCEII
jgi:wyosine [tRNA(Phe)-imidazoG37] synthetase (radical SAM superfamily)